MIARLLRAWRTLVDEPGLPKEHGEVILTGPLPAWLYITLQAEATRQHKPLTDVIYQALHAQGLALIRHEMATKGSPHE